jgi:YD repeat-containing protein
VTTYVYDHLYRLVTTRYPASNIEYIYNAVNNRTAMTDTSGTTTYVYDRLYRPVTITSPATGTVGYRYDAVGNRTRVIYPTSQTVTYTYDAADRLVQVEDWDGGVTAYIYDGAGRVLTTTLPNGITTTHGYDDAGRLVRLAHAGPHGALFSYDYTLDGVGNRVGVREYVRPPTLLVYVPVVMHDYSTGGEAMMGGGESFLSPLPTPVPQPGLPDSSPSPSTPKKPLDNEGIPPKSSLLLGDPSLLLFAPLVVAAIVQRKKGRRWAALAARALLAIAAVGLGVVLAGWLASPTAAVPPTDLLPMPFLSPVPPPGSGLQLEVGTVDGVDDDNYTTVPLVHRYGEMVVIATATYANNTVPLVTRVRNAQGNSFQVKLQNADDDPNPLQPETIHYLVMEAEDYTLPDGRAIEGQVITSTLTDRKNSWQGQSLDYTQSYSNPVVLGQVMTENDADWSVFWDRGDGSRAAVPDSDNLWVGKHVGSDGDKDRADELLGVVVIEAGVGNLRGVAYQASLGDDIVRGIGDSPPYVYDFSPVFESAPQVALLSQAGMEGNDGSWAVLYGVGEPPLGVSSMNLAVDEDQCGDAERSHVAEPVAYLVFEEPVVYPPPPGEVTINYVYNDLDRLIEAEYSTGERFEYAYDKVGNRTAMTETLPLDGTTVTTYTYDTADRLLVSGSAGHQVSYGWDDRGNLTSNGIRTTPPGGWWVRRASRPRWSIPTTATACAWRGAPAHRAPPTPGTWPPACRRC